MNQPTPFDAIAVESSKRGKDTRTRVILLVMLILWLITVALLVIVAWNAYFQKKEQAQSLADQVTQACNSGDFGPGFSKNQEDSLCNRAEKISKDESVPLSIQGPRGPQGPEGPRGPQGIQGPQGMRGAMGLQGEKGTPGKDGADGAKGETGPIGPEGPKGDVGERGPVGPMGPEGPEGPVGPKGPSGLVNFMTVGCEGPIIRSIAVSYDATTQTATITCN